MKLYKFKSLEGDGLKHALDMIVNQRVFLATLKDMNDPEEGNRKLVDIGESYKQPGWQKKINDFKTVVEATRFTSFTEKANNPLLWAHYAGGFSGVAFEYDFPEDTYDIRPITYKGRPTITIADMERVTNRDIEPQDVDILRHKAPFWEYEDEYRLYQYPYNKAHFIKIKPSQIVLGSRATDTSNLFKSIAEQFAIPISLLLPNGEGKFVVYNSLTEEFDYEE